jgi:hypothetical protein
MKECMINNELTLHIQPAENKDLTIVQFIDKQGTIGVKVFGLNTRMYL